MNCLFNISKMEKLFGELHLGAVFKLYPNSPDSMIFEKISEKEAKHLKKEFGIILGKTDRVIVIAPS